MSTAQTCKRCPQFDHDRVYCNKYLKPTNKRQDWCDWRKAEWETWKMMKIMVKEN